ncbi:MAG: PEP-CTERM sorting domain-containing protein [Fimbriimonas sp.]|nr:PEP-CTERM sorting domain-containing protein [Fimbriimonas sp.]
MKKFLALSLMGLASAGAFAQYFPLDSLIVASTAVYGTGTGLFGPGTGVNANLLSFSYDGGTLESSPGIQRSFSLGSNFVVSNSATSEAGINSSTNSLSMAGYFAPNGTANVAAGLSDRGVRTFRNVNGGVSSALFIHGEYRGGSVRSSFAEGGPWIYTAGTGNEGGWRVLDFTEGKSNQFGETTDTRVIKVINKKVYGSTGPATGNGGAGVYDLNNGYPIAVALSASPYDFDIVADGANTYAVIADDSSLANGGGLKVYLNGSLVKTFAATGLRNFAIRRADAGFEIFGITGASTGGATNELSKLIINYGTLATSTNTFSVIATSAPNTWFRGVEVVPEPASMAVLGIGLAGLAARRRRNK